MTSFKIAIDPRRRLFVHLLGDIRHALNQALTEEHKDRGLTQADIGRVLGKNRSFVSRKLSGASNMTLETLADLAYALGRGVTITLPLRRPVGQSNRPTTAAQTLETRSPFVMPGRQMDRAPETGTTPQFSHAE